MGLAGDRLGDLRATHPRATGRLLGAVDAALDEVDPRRLVRSALTPAEGGVLAGGHFVAAQRVAVLAFGKAATGMSRGAADTLGPLVTRGLVVTDQTERAPEWAELLVGGHPVPDEESIEAAERAIDLARGVEPGELMLALVSGGGSALLEAPAEGLSLDDIQDLNDQLIRSGAPIETINRVRQAVSRVKAGRLAARCRSPVVTLVVSDVGDNPAVVASGPTVTAPSNPAPVGEILDRYSIRGDAADRARHAAAAGIEVSEARHAPENDLALILADGMTAGRAAIRFLSSAGLNVSPTPGRLSGDTGEAVLTELRDTPEGAVRVLAGETTVEVCGQGKGGRNQHAAVTAGIEIAGSHHRFLAFGTDGVDGPTDAAGGCVDGATVAEPALARSHLDACDSYPYLEAVGGLLRTGRTGTNVADLWIVDRSGNGPASERIVIS
ncbi:MAG: DUF4147 domain-containing protein [bacterium]|nr:DUF4147 domain-containing protein [bacterium]